MRRTKEALKKTQVSLSIPSLPDLANRLPAAFAEDSTVCIKFPLIHLVFLLKKGPQTS